MNETPVQDPKPLGSANDRMASERIAILEKALALVPFEGWTVTVLRRAADEAGVARETQRQAFPRGVVDLIEFYALECDRQMEDALASRDVAAMKVRERITLAVRVRLETLIAHKGAAQKALAFLANPIHGATAAGIVARTVDRIWRVTGDTSTDVNFYTKRAVLAGVYSSTLLVMLDDTSPDHAETLAFLDRRIGNVMEFEKAKASAKATFAQLPNPLGLLSTLRYGAARRSPRRS